MQTIIYWKKEKQTQNTEEKYQMIFVKLHDY